MNAPWRSLRSEERAAWFASHWYVLVPILFIAAAHLLETAPLFTGLPAMPLLGLLALYAWTLYQPALMPAWLALPCGLLADFLSAAPLGLNATLYPLVVLLVAALERRFGHRTFLADWLLLFPVLALYALLTVSLARFAHTDMDVWLLVPMVFASALAWPAVAFACQAVQHSWTAR